jgi:hypothetical protein
MRMSATICEDQGSEFMAGHEALFVSGDKSKSRQAIHQAAVPPATGFSFYFCLVAFKLSASLCCQAKQLWYTFL